MPTTLAPGHVGMWKQKTWVKQNCVRFNEEGLEEKLRLSEIKEGAEIFYDGQFWEVFLYDHTKGRVFLERIFAHD